VRSHAQRRLIFAIGGLCILGAFFACIYFLFLTKRVYDPPKVQFGIAVRSGDIGKQFRDTGSAVQCPVSFIALDCLWDDEFPFDAVQYISKKDAIPVLRWTPLFADAFEQFAFSSIVDGTWDDHINRWAQRAKESDYSMVIVLFADFNREEMGLEDLDSQAESFKAAFRYIVKKFEDKKVNNVTWVWQVANDYEVIPKEGLAGFYPGFDIVDYVGMSLSYSVQASMQDDLSQLMAAVVPTDDRKPLMVTITDVQSFPEQLDWIKKGVAYAVTHKSVKAIVLDVPESFPYNALRPAFATPPFTPSERKNPPE